MARSAGSAGEGSRGVASVATSPCAPRARGHLLRRRYSAAIPAVVAAGPRAPPVAGGDLGCRPPRRASVRVERRTKESASPSPLTSSATWRSPVGPRLAPLQPLARGQISGGVLPRSTSSQRGGAVWLKAQPAQPGESQPNQFFFLKIVLIIFVIFEKP